MNLTRSKLKKALTAVLTFIQEGTAINILLLPLTFLFLKDGTLESLLYDSRDFFDKHNLNGLKSKKDILKNATLVKLQGDSTDENIQKALGI